MWINSPLGQWEQNARVEVALAAGERMRMLEKTQAGDEGGGSSTVLYRVKARLPWEGNRLRRAADTVQAMLMNLHVRARDQRQAS